MLMRVLGDWWRAVIRGGETAGAAAALERARVLERAGDLGGALRVLERALERFGTEPELWNQLGIVHLAAARYAAAETAFRRALELRPALPEAHCNLGIALAEQGKEGAALESFERSIALAPRLLAAHENRARLLTHRVEDAAALAAWREVLALEPRRAEAHAAIGMLRLRAGDFEGAREAFSAARALGSDPDALALGEALLEVAVGDPAAGRARLAALRGRIADADLDWNLALAHLAEGDFSAGWPLYEARLRKRYESPRRNYPFPEWDGRPLEPGALLVMAEQGLGDEIMFASCYPDLLERAPGCVLECDPRLAPLFARSFPGARAAGVARDADPAWLARYPRLRCQIHAGSLPRWYRASAQSFPRHSGYLRADRARVHAWKQQLAALPGTLKVGIAWRGGLEHTRRALRSLAPHELAPLLGGSPHAFVSLQHDDDGAEAALLAETAGARVAVFRAALEELDETAALVAALDLVVSVCSSLVHLAGALGTPAWVLTPRVAEWRYQRSGETLPWYPSVRLFRQQRLGEWAPVVAQVAARLRAAGEGSG